MISPILIAMIILICVFLDRVSDRFGIPVLLGFILLGIFFGSDGVVKIPFDNYSFAEQVCSIALIFIMFYGGFGTNWEHARPAAGKAVLLSTFQCTFSATKQFTEHFVKLRFDFLKFLTELLSHFLI